MKHNLVAAAVARSIASNGLAANVAAMPNQPNWLQRLSGFIVHPKVPKQMRDDVARLLAERALLLEMQKANNLVFIVGKDSEEEKRYIAASNAIKAYGAFE